MAKAITALVLSLVFLGCAKDAPQQSKSSPLSDVMTADLKAPVVHPPYDLNVILYGPGNNGGFVKFTQNKDTAKIVNLNTYVGNLRPNHPYLLQRAVNAITDTTKCSSTAWLTLGEGLTPQSITTNISGNGNENLWRDLSAVASGTEFYIHFQVIDSVSQKVVLNSGCYQYTVR